jgi:hypothetical protein
MREDIGIACKMGGLTGRRSDPTPGQFILPDKMLDADAWKKWRIYFHGFVKIRRHSRRDLRQRVLEAAYVAEPSVEETMVAQQRLRAV